jgi:hypothetical protein
MNSRRPEMAKKKSSTETLGAMEEMNAPKASPKAVKPKRQPKPKALENVTIEGRARRMQTFNLPHEIYCAAFPECQCTMGEVTTSYTSKEDKQRHTITKKKRMNKSIRIRFKQRVTIPRIALECPEVDAALKNKDLRRR